jgi:hypothetical protein
VLITPQTVKSELQKIQKLGLRPPMLSDVESADLEIWIDLPAGLDLKPKTASLADSDHRLWSTPNEDIYFQRYVLPRRIIRLNVKTNIYQELALICQESHVH